ncbi:hypothetical protein [Martelella radicis]|uniref:Uncharacterized protein n=1 Tax=Martelella radicis TaxID=1397476 RepID=A0A7W6KI70_9HYPH|nr:hypothetical protein [Martelella radicis]MBB4120380.1 hypothetical protein [Martelella radicis]
MMSIPKSGQEGAPRADPLASAAGATALVLALNKPVYPLYVWFLAESAFHLSLLTALTMPFYLAVWYLSRIGASRAARLGMVIVGIVDTLAIAFILGGESDMLAFLFACLMLAGLCFYRSEIWLSRGLIAVIFVLFVALEGRIGGPLMSVSERDMQNLAFLNITGAAALAAFIMLRFPRPWRPD